MDSEETLVSKPTFIGRLASFSTFPVVGVIFALIASMAFYVSHTRDEQVWLTLYNLHSSHLLKKESALYLDFYNKRLSIEKQGSQTQSTRISEAVQLKDNKQLTRFILSDRAFRTYLEQKAPIYFSSSEKEHWLTHNQELTSQLLRLTSYQFAIIPEVFASSPSIKTLFTYIFVDDRLENLLSNILILLILSSIFERFIKRNVFVAAIIGSSITLSCLYIFVANSFSPPLQALNCLIYILGMALFSAFLRAHDSKALFKSWPILLSGLVLLSLKILFDYYFNVFNSALLMCLVPLCACAVLLAWFTQRLLALPPTIENQVNSLAKEGIEQLSRSNRHKYAEALSGLSRFHFPYARQALRSLRTEQAHSLQILESAYHLEKLCPEDADFWSLAEYRVDQCLVTQNYPDMLGIFQDIQKSAPSRDSASKHISPDHYLKMLIVFLNHNDIEKAEHAFMFLELAGKPTLVKEACKLLIEAFSKKQNSKKTKHYQALFSSYLEIN